MDSSNFVDGTFCFFYFKILHIFFFFLFFLKKSENQEKKNYTNFKSGSFAKVFVRFTKSFFTSHLLSKIKFLLKEGNLIISWIV
jgi:hypothetical protein